MNKEKSRWSRFYEAFEEWTSGILLFTGLTLIMINVTLRYVWGMPESLLDEFSVYFVVWGTFAGMSQALRTNHHIKVDMFYDMMPVRLKRGVSTFAHSLGIAFCLFYTYFGILLVQDYLVTGQGSTDSQLPLWIVYLIMPISGVMFGARFIQKLVFLFKYGGGSWSDEMEIGAIV